MAVEASQIALWLKMAREAKGLTQDAAFSSSGVGRGVVTAAEQGRAPRADNFLALVLFYGAEDLLAQQIKDWRAGKLLAGEKKPRNPDLLQSGARKGKGTPAAPSKRVSGKTKPHRPAVNE